MINNNNNDNTKDLFATTAILTNNFIDFNFFLIHNSCSNHRNISYSNFQPYQHLNIYFINILIYFINILQKDIPNTASKLPFFFNSTLTTNIISTKPQIFLTSSQQPNKNYKNFNCSRYELNSQQNACIRVWWYNYNHQ